MSVVRFRVDEVFDLASRGGLLVCGTVIEGEPIGVPAFRDAASGHVLTLLGVEFQTPRTRDTGQIVFVLDRGDREYALAGAEWIAGASNA